MGEDEAAVLRVEADHHVASPSTGTNAITPSG